MIIGIFEPVRRRMFAFGCCVSLVIHWSAGRRGAGAQYRAEAAARQRRRAPERATPTRRGLGRATSPARTQAEHEEYQRQRAREEHGPKGRPKQATILDDLYNMRWRTQQRKKAKERSDNRAIASPAPWQILDPSIGEHPRPLSGETPISSCWWIHRSRNRALCRGGRQIAPVLCPIHGRPWLSVARCTLLHCSEVSPPMAEWVRKRTWRSRIAMSASPLKADILRLLYDVGFGPIADIGEV
jgi:hypothetical protein